ncbi:MAG: hypothetical protein LBJ67_12885 [Planctomycetaceae bacterium]|nr:hypothetical protein [Planctomycetaceae bacterium]
MDKYHVAKHFETTTDNGQFSFQRHVKSIRYESELDGFYVICPNVSSAEHEASDIVREKTHGSLILCEQIISFAPK